MDGNRTIRKWATAAAVAAAVGCAGTGPKTVTGTTLPGAGEGKISRLINGGPPGPVKSQPEVVAAKPKVSALKSETNVSFADVQVDAAYLDNTTTQETNRLLDDARQRYQKVLVKDPNNADAMRGLARLYTRTGDRERAYASYQQLIQVAPKDHKAAHEFALACGRFEDWPNATTACERALAADPENRRYHRTLGVCLAHAGQYERSFDAMLKAAPEAEARFTLARVLADTNQPELAKQQMQLAVQADPSFEPAKEWLGQGGDVQQAGFQTPSR